MLVISSSIPFYADHVYLPHKGDPTPSKIYENSKFYPFFKDALGAIDGMHINCCPPAADHEALCYDSHGLFSFPLTPTPL